MDFYIQMLNVSRLRRDVSAATCLARTRTYIQPLPPLHTPPLFNYVHKKHKLTVVITSIPTVDRQGAAGRSGWRLPAGPSSRRPSGPSSPGGESARGRRGWTRFRSGRSDPLRVTAQTEGEWWQCLIESKKNTPHRLNGVCVCVWLVALGLQRSPELTEVTEVTKSLIWTLICPVQVKVDLFWKAILLKKILCVSFFEKICIP
jgi:hypothetical protein